MPKYTLGGDPPQSRSEQVLMGQDAGPAQSRLEELLKNGTGGGVTPEQLAAAIAAYFEQHPIPEELPDKTSASIGDFLRLDAQKNPVWQTIPSAESNSFGGGSYWTPDATPALWTEVAKPGEIPVWKQPTGVQDAYDKGDRVWYPDKNGHIYDGQNSWSPDDYPQGWLLIE